MSTLSIINFYQVWPLKLKFFFVYYVHFLHCLHEWDQFSMWSLIAREQTINLIIICCRSHHFKLSLRPIWIDQYSWPLWLSWEERKDSATEDSLFLCVLWRLALLVGLSKSVPIGKHYWNTFLFWESGSRIELTCWI